MIVTVSGTVAEKIAELVVIDVQGVGYGVLVSSTDFDALAIGVYSKLYIYEQIKEDAHNLYGFQDLDSKKLFEQLLGVKNVGPKVALAVLNIGTTNSVRAAIAAGDVKSLQTAKGVGKRAAEQIVVELRDKVGVPVGEGAEGVVGRPGMNNTDEALQALVALGYAESDAFLALQGISNELATEERIKLALKGNN